MPASFDQEIVRRAWSAILPELTLSSPELALELQLKLGRSSDQYGYASSSVHGTFYAWAPNDPAGAAAHALQLTGRDREAALGSVAMQCATKDSKAALEWAQALPAGPA